MNMEGLDYNTQRTRLQLPEYGREIQKMVDYAKTISDRSERQRCAESIVAIMQRMDTPDGNGDIAKYWNHLALMSDFTLDVDYPFEISKTEGILSKPNPMTYPKNKIRVRHYGAIMDKVFDKLKAMPAGSERDKLAAIAANRMKACLVEYGHGAADDRKVADDLAFFTDGKVQLDLDSFRFSASPQSRNTVDRKRRNRQ